MRTTVLASVLLVGVFAVGAPLASAQDQKHWLPQFEWSSTDLAITYTTEKSNVIPAGGGSFWLQGGSTDGAFTFFHGFGLAVNITGDYATRIAPGVNLSEITFLGGPRYTKRLRSKHESRIFAEALGGAVKGFDGVFPFAAGVNNHASSFALQLGGGLDISLTKHFALRAIEADYVRTYLPNNTNNRQVAIFRTVKVQHVVDKLELFIHGYFPTWLRVPRTPNQLPRAKFLIRSFEEGISIAIRETLG
jgi:hypothetical protein